MKKGGTTVNIVPDANILRVRDFFIMRTSRRCIYCFANRSGAKVCRAQTVSIVNETPINMYEKLVGKKKGFLLESYDKNYDRYTFFGPEPEEIITSRGNSLVITKADGTEEVLEGNPCELLKEYYSSFEIRKDNQELAFTGGLVGNLGYDFVRYTETLPDDNPDTIGIRTGRSCGGNIDRHRSGGGQR